jgi:hypothetical protein
MAYCVGNIRQAFKSSRKALQNPVWYISSFFIGFRTSDLHIKKRVFDIELPPFDIEKWDFDIEMSLLHIEKWGADPLMCVRASLYRRQ